MHDMSLYSKGISLERLAGENSQDAANLPPVSRLPWKMRAGQESGAFGTSCFATYFCPQGPSQFRENTVPLSSFFG